MGLLAAAPGFAWFVVGDAFDSGSGSPDHLVEPWTLLVRHDALVGVVSMGVVLVLASALIVGRARCPRHGGVVFPWAVLVAFAVWLGIAYRIVTAGVVGANIGGVMALAATPVLGVVAVGIAVGLWWSARDRGGV